MNSHSKLSRLALAVALGAVAGAAHAQDQTQTQTQGDASAQQDALQGVEPVVPVGAPIIPVDVDPAGPPIVPVAPVEKFEGVETVTLQTDRGPVVVVSWPGTVPDSEYNIDFTALDANGDGFIARQEAQAMDSRSEAAHNLNLEFQVADKNSDGRLAFTEIIQWVY